MSLFRATKSEVIFLEFIFSIAESAVAESEIQVGFLWAAIFMGEEITLLKITGAVLVMIGVVLPHLLQLGIKRYSI